MGGVATSSGAHGDGGREVRHELRGVLPLPLRLAPRGGHGPPSHRDGGDGGGRVICRPAQWSATALPVKPPPLPSLQPPSPKLLPLSPPLSHRPPPWRGPAAAAAAGGPAAFAAASTGGRCCPAWRTPPPTSAPRIPHRQGAPAPTSWNTRPAQQRRWTGIRGTIPNHRRQDRGGRPSSPTPGITFPRRGDGKEDIEYKRGAQKDRWRQAEGSRVRRIGLWIDVSVASFWIVDGSIEGAPSPARITSPPLRTRCPGGGGGGLRAKGRTSTLATREVSSSHPRADAEYGSRSWMWMGAGVPRGPGGGGGGSAIRGNPFGSRIKGYQKDENRGGTQFKSIGIFLRNG